MSQPDAWLYGRQGWQVKSNGVLSIKYAFCYNNLLNKLYLLRK